MEGELEALRLLNRGSHRARILATKVRFAPFATELLRRSGLPLRATKRL
jgi:hypothetical protein